MDKARCLRFERPSWSTAVSERDPNAVPHSVMEEDDSFNEDLDPSDQSCGLLRTSQKPQRLDAVGEHGQEGHATYRVPISNAEVLDVGHLFPTSYSFFNSPPAKICEDDLLGLLDAFDLVVGEQGHIFRAEAGEPGSF